MDVKWILIKISFDTPNIYLKHSNYYKTHIDVRYLLKVPKKFNFWVKNRPSGWENKNVKLKSLQFSICFWKWYQKQACFLISFNILVDDLSPPWNCYTYFIKFRTTSDLNHLLGKIWLVFQTNLKSSFS